MSISHQNRKGRAGVISNRGNDGHVVAVLLSRILQQGYTELRNHLQMSSNER